ncbi:hypothetical protein HFO71_24295 [Rhizobium laguerreae]|uniref:hypothetical protein n=1 Tax=Rhizobium laguerreae TaxID=1076926 RepID=UPI001C91ED45|nr:hypothetical protein [Rhizobium laguerreae]MBY3073438.1 hypothetical protein [Rhizobium laguerreae]
MKNYHFVFTGMPSPEGAIFVEIEDGNGISIKAGDWRNRDDGLCELVVPAPDSSTAEERDRLRDENERLRVICRDTQMLAYKWQEAHDCLKAGLPYSFPSPADLPECEAENERLRGALHAVSGWLQNGDYDNRNGLAEMDRIASICDAALNPTGAS